MNWLKRIEECKNINQLPLYSELMNIAEDEDVDLYGVWNGKIIIADGTEIELETSSHYCFADRKNEWIFYHIIDSKIYICAECGLWQKSFNKIKTEVGYSEGSEELLLPYSWNENGIKAYLKKRIEKQQKYEDEGERRYKGRRQDYLNSIDKDCTNCTHWKNNECEYCNYFDDGDDEYECEDWEYSNER